MEVLPGEGAGIGFDGKALESVHSGEFDGSTEAKEDAKHCTVSEQDDNCSVASSDSNSEQDQIRCRICHSSSGVLYRPCACSGSIAHIHQDCLMQWLHVKNMRQCEVCHTTYVFTPIYSTDAPGYASFIDVAHWLSEKAMSLYPKLLRCILVMASWLVLVPLITSWMWRLCFVASIQDLIAIADLGADSLWYGLQTGVLLCFLVLTVTVIVAAFRELMREEHHLAGGQVGAGGDGLFPGEDELFEGDEPGLDEVVDDVPFSTWIGFTGPIKFFFVHLTSVVLYNTVFLAVAVFIPLQAGRLFLSILRLDTESFARWVFALVGEALQLGLIGEAYTPTPERYAAMYNVLPVKDASLLACGYIFLMVLAVVWGPLSSFLRIHDVPLIGVIYGLLRYVLTGFKFGALVGFELGVFPVYLGWCLDLLVLDLVDSTWEARKRFFHGAPITSMAMHWFLGINFILYVSFVASLLRRTIKRRVLSRFLRYPDDPDFQPFHDFIYVPLYKHCKRLCVSGLLYTLLVVLCVHVPAKVFTRLFPSVAPLRWRLGERSEVPVDLLLFHFAIPAIMGHVDLRGVCLDAVKGWFIFISGALGVDDYLLREDVLGDGDAVAAGEGEGGIGEEQGPAEEPGPAEAQAQEEKVQREGQEEKVPEEKVPGGQMPSDEKENGGDCDAPKKDDEEEEEKDLREEKYLGHKSDQKDSSSAELKSTLLWPPKSVNGASTPPPSPPPPSSAPPPPPTQAIDHDDAPPTLSPTPRNEEVKMDWLFEEDGLNDRVDEADLDVPAPEAPEAPDSPAPQAPRQRAIPRFTLRVFILVLSTWAMHTLVLCACVLVPVVVGRMLLRSECLGFSFLYHPRDSGGCLLF
uniref:RING-type E3 ubiquitin transferase n=1 Tax=Lotharella globosa TaxID=91324 RepID=A0A7S3YSG1_9EUKA